MSPNRKADLQRKLAMAPIPKPPAGLAERIKSEIPQHLLVDVRKERERLSRSIAFNLRVAASVILLIGSVYLALHVLTRAEVERTRQEIPTNVVARKAATPPVAAAAPARVTESAPPVQLPKPFVAPPAAKKEVLVAEAKPEPLARRERERAADAGAVAGGSGMAQPSAPAPAPPPPPSVMAAPPAAAAEAAAPQSAVADAAPRAAMKSAVGFVPEANAAAISLAPKTLFDIVVPRAGDELHGAALIQHFAAPARPPRALRLDAEAALLDDTALLRVSVDLPDVPHPLGGSRPPVAADATLDVVFDGGAIASHRALAGQTTSSERALPSGTSVTALFEIELKPELARRATIATVMLRYRSVTDGKEHVLTRKLRRSDLREWGEASRRMKSTSLAAALVHSLEPKEKVAERARAAGLSEIAELAEKR